MISARHNLKRLLLLLGDLAVFEASLVLTLAIRYGSVSRAWSSHVWPFTIVASLWIVGFYIAGLYDLVLLRDSLKLFRTYLEGMMANLAIAVAFFYLLPVFGIAPRTNLFLYFVVSLLFGYLWRLVFHQWIADRFARGRVLLVGPAEDARALDRLFKTSALGLDLVAALPTSGEPDRALNILWTTGLDAFENLLSRERISAIVLSANIEKMPELKQPLYRTLFSPITIIDRAEIEEITTGRIPLSYVSESWFLHHLHEPRLTWYEGLKRAIDVFLAIPFGILTLVLLPFIAIAIKVNSVGPAFFSQVRVGKNGKEIRIWKFRSMRTDAEKNGPQFTFSAKTDPRLTSVGRFIRRTRLDELPQIWNVIKGDLSFIGPRPERPEFVAPLVERMPYYALRHLTRPGLTGWAQVLFLTPTSSLEDNLKKLQYDLYYIKHRSLLLDLAIFLKTIGIVLRRQGT